MVRVGFDWCGGSAMNDRARKECRQGWHSDPDNYGMCIYCAVILDPEPGEDPNDYRRKNGWPDVPPEPPNDEDH